MRGFGKLSSIVGLGLFTAAGAATPAWAQVSRSWVSSTGSGVTCSRAAPCGSFQAAHDATAAGGEINCVDAGSYGPLTITRSMTVDCSGVFGATQSAGGSVVLINTAGVNVVLRGLSFSGGTGTSQTGVVFQAGESLTIENVTIQNFDNSGIFFGPVTASRLHVVDTLITNNGSGAPTTAGITIDPAGAGYANVTLEDVRLIGNSAAALRVDVTGNTGSSTSIVANRSAFTSSQNGVSVIGPAGTAGARVTLLRSIVTNNVVNGLLATGPSAQILASNTAITGNSNGVLSSGGGSLGTYGNNELVGNGSNGSFNGFLTQN